jgi:putative oxidoreductase
VNKNDPRLALLIGRIIAGLFYLYAGINNLADLPKAVDYAAFKGIPLPLLVVVAASCLLLFGGVSILTGYKPQVGVLTIILFLVPVTLMLHGFWTIHEPQAWLQEIHGFFGNLALAGSSLMFLGVPRPWLWSLDELLQHAGNKPSTATFLP